MAVAFNAAGAGASSTASAAALSLSHTSSGAGRAGLVALAVGHGNASSYTAWTRSGTWGGAALTLLGAIDSGAATAGFIQLFGIIGQPTGAQTISVSATKSGVTPTSLIGCSVSYTGVGSFGTVVTASATAGAPSIVVPSAVGGMAAAAFTSGTDIATPTQTQRYVNNALSDATAASNMLFQDAAGAASVTFGAASNGDWWGMVGVPLNAATTKLVPIIKQQLTVAVRRAGFY